MPPPPNQKPFNQLTTTPFHQKNKEKLSLALFSWLTELITENFDTDCLSVYQCGAGSAGNEWNLAYRNRPGYFWQDCLTIQPLYSLIMVLYYILRMDYNIWVYIRYFQEGISMWSFEVLLVVLKSYMLNLKYFFWLPS